VAATCAAATGNSVASTARLLGVSRSTIYLEGSYLSQQMLRRLDPAR
jgi:Bacterial regulatory protein, Fis family